MHPTRKISAPRSLADEFGIYGPTPAWVDVLVAQLLLAERAFADNPSSSMLKASV